LLQSGLTSHQLSRCFNQPAHPPSHSRCMSCTHGWLFWIGVAAAHVAGCGMYVHPRIHKAHTRYLAGTTTRSPPHVTEVCTSVDGANKEAQTQLQPELPTCKLKEKVGRCFRRRARRKVKLRGNFCMRNAAGALIGGVGALEVKGELNAAR
jgi:hypothetical protein